MSRLQGSVFQGYLAARVRASNVLVLYLGRLGCRIWLAFESIPSMRSQDDHVRIRLDEFDEPVVDLDADVRGPVGVWVVGLQRMKSRMSGSSSA